jgi:hypothetical protein
MQVTIQAKQQIKQSTNKFKEINSFNTEPSEIIKVYQQGRVKERQRAQGSKPRWVELLLEEPGHHHSPPFLLNSSS